MKTRYDIAEELVKAFPYSDTIKDNDTTIVDIVLSLAEEWILVKDELPDESFKINNRFSCRLLTKQDDGNESIDVFDYYNNRFMAKGATHWRPINRK